MRLTGLKPLTIGQPSKSLQTAHDRYSKLLQAVSDKDLSEETIEEINVQTTLVNEVDDPKKFKMHLLKKRHAILQILEKKENLVANNHHRNLWMALGMTAFGLPLGLAIAMALGNMAFLAIGLPIGLPLGMAVGAQKDKQAKEEGRQLDCEA